MTRKIGLLFILCSLVSILVAQDSKPREITIHPFTSALVAKPDGSDGLGTVKFQQEHSRYMPRYTMIINGAPALEVCLGFKGVVLDVYHNADGKKNRILSTNWKGKDRDYEGLVVSEKELFELGINQEELLSAVAFLPSIHYPLSKNTWTNVSQAAVQKGEVSLWIHPPQPEWVVADVQPATDQELPINNESSILSTNEAEEESSVITESESIREGQENQEKEAQRSALQQQVLDLVAQAEEVHAELTNEDPAPPTLEEEQRAVAEFIQTLPQELQEEAISLEIERLDC